MNSLGKGLFAVRSACSHRGDVRLCAIKPENVVVEMGSVAVHCEPPTDLVNMVEKVDVSTVSLRSGLAALQPLRGSGSGWRWRRRGLQS